jgi:hypothetical protein
MDTTRKKLIYKTLKQGSAKKFFSGGLRALVDHQEGLAQPANPLLKFQPRTGTNQ